MFWCQDNESGKQHSLGTKERRTAERLLNAKNEPVKQPTINLQIARAYVGDPAAVTRTWQYVMDEILKLKKGETGGHWKVAVDDKAFDLIRKQPVLETRAENFLKAMEFGKVSTNVYLRRIHNFAIGMNWIPVPVIPVKQWPSIHHKEQRAITWDEHKAIILSRKK